MKREQIWYAISYLVGETVHYCWENTVFRASQHKAIPRTQCTAIHSISF